MMPGKGLFIAFLLAAAAQAAPVGIFTEAADVGAVSRPTDAAYDPDTGTYTIGASGDNIWAARDAFGFAWKQSRGDVSLAARVEIQGKSEQEHRKAGLMLRQSLAPDSVYVDVVIHGNGLTSLQFRTETGGPTREIQCARQAPSAARLEKRGDYVLLLLANDEGRFEHTPCSIKLAFTGFYYAGLVVCAHDNNAYEVVKFRRVSLGLLPARSEIRMSAIELVPLDSLDRKVVYQTTARLDSPSFTATGNAVCFREDGRMYFFSLTANSDPHLVGAENVEECELAHPAVDSPWKVAHEIKGGRAQLFRRGSGKGKPLQLTRDHYSSWTPRLSPDGQSIAFVSSTLAPENGKPVMGDYLLRQLPIEGGEPRELARFYGGPGALGPSPWSADGKQLVFVSREPD
ncbi:MAG: hypothetical protein ABI769_04945 [Pseudomonadota bacterium]